MRCLESHVVCGFGITCCVWVWNHMLCVGLESHFVCGLGITFCVWAWNHILCVGLESHVVCGFQRSEAAVNKGHAPTAHTLPPTSKSAACTIACGRESCRNFSRCYCRPRLARCADIFVFERHRDTGGHGTAMDRLQEKERGRECVCVCERACKCLCEREYA